MDKEGPPAVPLKILHSIFGVKALATTSASKELTVRCNKAITVGDVLDALVISCDADNRILPGHLDRRVDNSAVVHDVLKVTVASLDSGVEAISELGGTNLRNLPIQVGLKSISAVAHHLRGDCIIVIGQRKFRVCQNRAPERGINIERRRWAAQHGIGI